MVNSNSRLFIIWKNLFFFQTFLFLHNMDSTSCNYFVYKSVESKILIKINNISISEISDNFLHFGKFLQTFIAGSPRWHGLYCYSYSRSCNFATVEAQRPNSTVLRVSTYALALYRGCASCGATQRREIEKVPCGVLSHNSIH